MSKEPSIETVRWSEESILDLIRKVRNDLVKDFLDERHLLDYLSTNFRIKEVPKVRLEFIRSDLKDLLISPVNTSHYKDVIRQIRETDSASISTGNDALFYREIEAILKKYLY
jgi:hypothetical protein